MKWVFLLGLVVSQGVLATDWVCVRNYVTEKGNACDSSPLGYSWISGSLEEGKKVCTRTQNDMYCQGTKEYRRVVTEEGQTVCVMDYGQDPIINYCESVPELYAYVSPASESVSLTDSESR